MSENKNMIRDYFQTTATDKCPECGCPNGWHSFGCEAGIALCNEAFAARKEPGT